MHSDKRHYAILYDFLASTSSDCFIGDQCQLYVKSIGLTLDDILREEIRSNTTFLDQSFSVKMSAAVTMIMFVAGSINSVLSFLTFQSKESRQVGCVIYLLASSITSLFTISMLTIKFWFFIGIQINLSTRLPLLRGGCILIEPLLKLFLYLDSWLNACVAVERAATVYKGINFNKEKSKHIAQLITVLLPFSIIGTIIHEPLHRQLLIEDKGNETSWCVVRYSHSVQNYNTSVLFFHFLVPFFANLLSAIFIIFKAARHRSITRTGQNYMKHICEQLSEHKQLVISPLILVILSLPRLIISLLTSCVKASRHTWLYLSCYFISFVPSVLVFVLFVLPSSLYKKQFKESIRNWRRQIHRK